MESGNQLITLLCCHDVGVYPGKDLYFIRQNLINIRSTDKSHGNVIAYIFHMTLYGETAQLAPISIATYINIHGGDTMRLLTIFLTCQQDKSGTGTKYGQTVLDILGNGGQQP